MARIVAWIIRYRRVPVWTYRIIIGLLFLQAVLGYGGPMAARTNWLVNFEGWLKDHTHDPIAVAFLSGLILSTWLIPDGWNWWKRHFSGSSRTTLRVLGPDLYQHPSYQHTNRWRMVVHNSGSVGAKNVKMRLLDIQPAPRDGAWLSNYPYEVNTTTKSSGGIQINPDDKEQFEVVAGWPNSEGNIFTEGLDTKDMRNRTQIMPDETWDLFYEVVSENADKITVSLEICVADKSIMVRSKN